MVEKSLLLPHGVVPFHYDALSMTRLTFLSRFFYCKKHSTESTNLVKTNFKNVLLLYKQEVLLKSYFGWH
jgi:hypothetical protein